MKDARGVRWSVIIPKAKANACSRADLLRESRRPLGKKCSYALLKRALTREKLAIDPSVRAF